jgi:hypothetical protein
VFDPFVYDSRQINDDDESTTHDDDEYLNETLLSSAIAAT